MCIYTGGCISDTCVENGVTKKNTSMLRYAVGKLVLLILAVASGLSGFFSRSRMIAIYKLYVIFKVKRVKSLFTLFHISR